jgi:predicted PurR-regulated permease PerM
MLKKYKHEIIIALLLIGLSISFYYLYGILFPFVLGLLLAFSVNPTITRIQKLIKNRDLATTLFLAVSTGLVILFFVFFTQYINQDFKRLNNSVIVLAADNQDKLDHTAQKVKGYVGYFYDFEELESTLNIPSDSLTTDLQTMDFSQLDTESIKEGFSQILSLLPSSEEGTLSEKPSFGFLFMLLSTLMYFILILYQLDYFTSIRKRYFSPKVKSGLNVILDDFNQSFMKYIKLRTRIVLVLAVLYIVAFLILDMPGMILITLLIVLLSYIPYLQYLALIPLAVGCLVLSVENEQSFLLLFGIVVGVFVSASLIEELVLTPWIMEKNIGMNPVIMVLALSVWGYLLGLPGTLIGIPMTSLLIIYIKRHIIPSYKEVLQD